MERKKSFLYLWLIRRNTTYKDVRCTRHRRNCHTHPATSERLRHRQCFTAEAELIDNFLGSWSGHDKNLLFARGKYVPEPGNEGQGYGDVHEEVSEPEPGNLEGKNIETDR
jgi:hypothetical protein